MALKDYASVKGKTKWHCAFLCLHFKKEAKPHKPLFLEKQKPFARNTTINSSLQVTLAHKVIPYLISAMKRWVRMSLTVHFLFITPSCFTHLFSLLQYAFC